MKRKDSNQSQEPRLSSLVTETRAREIILKIPTHHLQREYHFAAPFAAVDAVVEKYFKGYLTVLTVTPSPYESGGGVSRQLFLSDSKDRFGIIETRMISANETLLVAYTPAGIKPADFIARLSADRPVADLKRRLDFHSKIVDELLLYLDANGFAQDGPMSASADETEEEVSLNSDFKSEIIDEILSYLKSIGIVPTEAVSELAELPTQLDIPLEKIEPTETEVQDKDKEKSTKKGYGIRDDTLVKLDRLRQLRRDELSDVLVRLKTRTIAAEFCGIDRKTWQKHDPDLWKHWHDPDYDVD